MPSVWSWYRSVVARWLLGYWNTAVPEFQVCSKFVSNFVLKGLYHVPYRGIPARIVSIVY